MNDIPVLPLPETLTPVDTTDFEVNTSLEIRLANMESNIRRQVPQVGAHELNPKNLVLVGGGWSLDQTFEELRELEWQGCPVMALNNAGNWLYERNIQADALVVLDARPMNIKFVERPIPNCKYFLSSQVDPALFEACEGRNTYIFHTISPDSTDAFEVRAREVLQKFYRGRYHHIIGGSTVGLRAMALARILGFAFMEVFGIDSCYSPEGRNHAYAQDWDDSEQAFRMKIRDREFTCSVWQYSQYENFLNFIKNCGEHFHLNIHGDGLLAYILKTGAEAKAERI